MKGTAGKGINPNTTTNSFINNTNSTTSFNKNN